MHSQISYVAYLADVRRVLPTILSLNCREAGLSSIDHSNKLAECQQHCIDYVAIVSLNV
jgi:hypothetical protein